MKIEFVTLEDILNWLMGREAKYEIYIVKESNNIVAMPTVSTRPVKVGVSPYKESINNTVDNIKKALPDIEGKIFIVQSIDYQVER